MGSESEKEVALYEKLFLQVLKVQDSDVPDQPYLTKYAHKIRARLRHAAEEFKTDHANMFAINMCLHAASSIILSHSPNLHSVLQELRGKLRETAGLQNKDATLVLTVCGLYYLVKWDTARAATEATTDAEQYIGELEQMRLGFDEINWLIGADAMQTLGLSKSPPRIPVTGTPVQQQPQEQKQQIAQQ